MCTRRTAQSGPRTTCLHRRDASRATAYLLYKEAPPDRRKLCPRKRGRPTSPLANAGKPPEDPTFRGCCSRRLKVDCGWRFASHPPTSPVAPVIKTGRSRQKPFFIIVSAKLFLPNLSYSCQTFHGA